MQMILTQAARKHRIGKAHIAHVIAAAVPVYGTRPTGEREARWVGIDDRGIELEIVDIPDAADKAGNPVTLIIHAMPTALRKN